MSANRPLLVEPAVRASPSCSATACPSICQRGEEKRTSQITDCLAEPSCAGLQSCADACACGNKACLTSCALLSPSTKALMVWKCVSANCPMLVVPAVRALSDCSTTACPSICKCGEVKCDCSAEFSGAGLQSCADACACDDQACFTGCALESPSTNASSVLQRLSVKGPLLAEPAARALPDGSATACLSINLDFFATSRQGWRKRWPTTAPRFTTRGDWKVGLGRCRSLSWRSAIFDNLM